MIETARRGSQSSSNEEGGDSRPLATPTAVVPDYSTELEEGNDDVIDSLGGTAKSEKNLLCMTIIIQQSILTHC